MVDENVTTTSNDLLLNGEDRLQLNEMMDLCTNLQKEVLDLKVAKTAQANEIDSLKKRVKKLEQKKKSRTLGLKRRFDDQMFDDQMFDAYKNLQGEEVVVAKQDVQDSAAQVNVVTLVTINEITLAKALEALKTSKPKIRGIAIREREETSKSLTTTQPIFSKSQDKGNAKIVEPKKPLKKKDQIMYDQEVTLNLQAKLEAKLEEKERLARQKEEESNIALIESWDNTQAMMDADYEVNTFVDYKTELMEESSKKAEESGSKRAGDKLKSDNLKKQKLDKNVEAEVNDDQEEVEMKKHMEIVPGEISIDVIPLATKPLIIIDCKIIKEGKM
uniref:Uncharacterized protein n=1 Tax=Tanacetum cinerariifolium TaxID=118510 RepID=A0A699GIT4_TANCI|nr:hypothetical protein [Tanacetum cinerariifolium]